MKSNPIGVMLNSFKVGIKEGIKQVKEMEVYGIQTYKVHHENWTNLVKK